MLAMCYNACMARTKKTIKAPPPAQGVAAANFRLPVALIEALDAWAERLNQASPMGRRWTRTDVVQEALARAVTERGAKGEIP